MRRIFAPVSIMTLPVWPDVVVNDNLGATGAEANASKWRATP